MYLNSLSSNFARGHDPRKKGNQPGRLKIKLRLVGLNKGNFLDSSHKQQLILSNKDLCTITNAVLNRDKQSDSCKRTFIC